MNKKDLVATFRKLGARDPEGWAQSQLDDGIPQLARYLFLRQAWGKIVKEGEPDWIEASTQRARTHPRRAIRRSGSRTNEVACARRHG
jgi:hypothetical protein